MVYSPLTIFNLTGGFSPSHPAVDLGWNKFGIKDPPVYAWDDGIVVGSYYDAQTGNCIVIKHPCSATQYYLSRHQHLKSRAVKVGDVVKGGQIIGIGGNTGSLSRGNHLHFELWLCPTSYVWSQSNQYTVRLKYATDPRNLFYTDMKGEGFKQMSVTSSNMPYAITTATNLRYRNLPSLTAIVLGNLPANTKIDYLGETNELDGYVWAKLLLSDRIVYSAIKYLVVTETPKTEIITVEVPVQVDATLTDGTVTVTVKTVGDK